MGGSVDNLAFPGTGLYTHKLSGASDSDQTGTCIWYVVVMLKINIILEVAIKTPS